MATQRKLGTTELLFRCAEQMGLQPSWVTPNGLFAVTVAGEEKYINFARSPLNSHTSASLAQNKYLTRLILARTNQHNIPFIHPQTRAEAEAFLAKHRKIIAKPLEGSGSRDIHIITAPAQLLPLQITGYILEQYIAGKEMRYLVLNNEVIGVHRSDYGVSVEEERPLKRISFPEGKWDASLVELSLQIARTLGLKFAAVDFLINDAGRHFILEVNSSPGLKWFHAPTSGPAIDVARQFLESMLESTDHAVELDNEKLRARPFAVQSV